jgi:hypothetical protein
LNPSESDCGFFENAGESDGAVLRQGTMKSDGERGMGDDVVVKKCIFAA